MQDEDGDEDDSPVESEWGVPPAGGEASDTESVTEKQK